MNKYIAILAAGIILTGCQQQDQAKEATAEGEQAKATEVTTETASSEQLIADQDKLSYAIGINMADSVGGINDQYESLGLKMDVVEQGFSDRLAKKAMLSEEDVKQQFQIFQQKMMFAQQQQQQKASADKAAENAAYLADNLAKGFTKTESGLQYKVIQAGKADAAKPSATDRVQVHYTGTFTDGRKFDSSVDSGKPFEFSLAGGVIQGWLEGVKLMSIGSKYQFVVPPELGYGGQDRGPIPANSILIFDVELISIVAQPAAEDKE